MLCVESSALLRVFSSVYSYDLWKIFCSNSFDNCFAAWLSFWFKWRWFISRDYPCIIVDRRIQNAITYSYKDLISRECYGAIRKSMRNEWIDIMSSKGVWIEELGSGAQDQELAQADSIDRTMISLTKINIDQPLQSLKSCYGIKEEKSQRR